MMQLDEIYATEPVQAPDRFEATIAIVREK